MIRYSLFYPFFKGMTDVDEIRIASNKIDRIEDYALPTQNTVKSLILEGNHVLEVPPLSALEDIQVEKVIGLNHLLKTNDAIRFKSETSCTVG